jgi:tetratricopeptide (TPR) repeat protein
MSNAAKHRKKAAEYEQLKQIDRAIASYVRAIEESEADGEDVDVALLNKVGDLALRQGRVPDAVTYYERAVEHYATAALFNNAIALCNKILRNAPGRSTVYFTLGRICARKGLRGDATRNFLEYATRMQQESRLDEAMRALGEVADLMPELDEVRRLVEEHAARAGVELPRRRTPPQTDAIPPADAARSRWDRSPELIFLDVDYGAPTRRTPPKPMRSTRTPPSTRGVATASGNALPFLTPANTPVTPTDPTPMRAIEVNALPSDIASAATAELMVEHDVPTGPDVVAEAQRLSPIELLAAIELEPVREAQSLGAVPVVPGLEPLMVSLDGETNDATDEIIMGAIVLDVLVSDEDGAADLMMPIEGFESLDGTMDATVDATLVETVDELPDESRDEFLVDSVQQSAPPTLSWSAEGDDAMRHTQVDAPSESVVDVNVDANVESVQDQDRNADRDEDVFTDLRSESNADLRADLATSASLHTTEDAPERTHADELSGTSIEVDNSDDVSRYASATRHTDSDANETLVADNVSAESAVAPHDTLLDTLLDTPLDTLERAAEAIQAEGDADAFRATAEGTPAPSCETAHMDAWETTPAVSSEAVHADAREAVHTDPHDGVELVPLVDVHDDAREEAREATTAGWEVSPDTAFAARADVAPDDSPAKSGATADLSYEAPHGIECATSTTSPFESAVPEIRANEIENDVQTGLASVDSLSASLIPHAATAVETDTPCTSITPSALPFLDLDAMVHGSIGDVVEHTPDDIVADVMPDVFDDDMLAAAGDAESIVTVRTPVNVAGDSSVACNDTAEEQIEPAHAAHTNVFGMLDDLHLVDEAPREDSKAEMPLDRTVQASDDVPDDALILAESDTAASSAMSHSAPLTTPAAPVASLRRPPFRLDPHDFILPGELPPLVVDDAAVDAGLRTLRRDADADAIADANADTFTARAAGPPVAAAPSRSAPARIAPAPATPIRSTPARITPARITPPRSTPAEPVSETPTPTWTTPAWSTPIWPASPHPTPARHTPVHPEWSVVDDAPSGRDDDLVRSDAAPADAADAATAGTAGETAMPLRSDDIELVDSTDVEWIEIDPPRVATPASLATLDDVTWDPTVADESPRSNAAIDAHQQTTDTREDEFDGADDSAPDDDAALSEEAAALRLAIEAYAVASTPSLPIAAVAAEANAVAASRRDSMRAAVAMAPSDWMLRRRLGEALFEAGQRDVGMAELETALSGFQQSSQLSEASDVAELLVRVSPERVSYHQKRVELAVRLQDQQRLRFAYLDLADTLIRSGEEARAQAVYVRVLEIDPYDVRARTALGSAAPPLPEPIAHSDDQFVNLADWLRDDVDPASTRMRMREPVASGDEEADFASLLRHFKEGVSRSLGEEDFESRYDLGVAFKEMGLLDDAIAEFQKALRSRAHRLPTYEALGQCFVEQGRYQVAATVLSRALHEPGLNDEQRVGVLYLLAYSCEALQRWGEARSYFQRVYATDINFRDVAARLAALEQVAS